MLNFAGLALFAVVAAAVVLLVRPDWRRQFLDWLRPIRPWHVAVAALLLAFFSLEGPFPGVVALSVLFVLLTVAWLRQFGFLMQLGDDAFPGRFDKLIWALLLIVLPPVGVLAFWSYREAHWPAKKSAYLHTATANDLA